jgi:hypothetical protein
MTTRLLASLGYRKLSCAGEAVTGGGGGGPAVVAVVAGSVGGLVAVVVGAAVVVGDVGTGALDDVVASGAATVSVVGAAATESPPSPSPPPTASPNPTTKATNAVTVADRRMAGRDRVARPPPVDPAVAVGSSLTVVRRYRPRATSRDRPERGSH